jgi:pimeloyl-ACP methyl ester carboxylesterase
MPSLRGGDLDVYYTDNGVQGGLGTIVLVHGNWATSSWWEPVLTSALAKPWRVIAYDVRGRGRTTGPDSDYSIPSLAADLGSFITALGLEPPHLVGHSLGSAIVMQYALEHPAQVRSLTAVGPAWVDGMPNPPGTVDRQWVLQEDAAAFFDAMSWLCPCMPMGRFWVRLLIEGHKQRWEATKANVMERGRCHSVVASNRAEEESAGWRREAHRGLRLSRWASPRSIAARPTLQLVIPEAGGRGRRVAIVGGHEGLDDRVRLPGAGLVGPDIRDGREPVKWTPNTGPLGMLN